MRVSLRAIGLVWLVILLLLGALAYNAYSRLRPEAFVELLQTELARSVPGAQLEVGELGYGVSLDLNLRLKSLRVLKEGTLLGTVGAIEIKVPWWAFLTEKGSVIQLNITEAEILVDPSRALPSPSGAPSSAAPPATEVKIAVPAPLFNSRLTLRAKDVVIRDQRDSRRYFNLAKLLVREFQFNRTSAFELNLPIDIHHNDAHVTSELWLFGDLVSGDDSLTVNFRGEFRPKGATEAPPLEDLVVQGTLSYLRQEALASGQLAFHLEKEKVGEGTLSLSREQAEVDLQFRKFPLNYLQFLTRDIGNPYLPPLNGHGSGSLRFRKALPGGKVQHQSRVSFDGDFRAGALVVPGKWQLGFDDVRWETSFMSPKADVSFFRRSLVDFKRGEVVQYSQELGFTGVDMGPIIGVLPGLEDLRATTTGPHHTSQISFKDCRLQNAPMAGFAKYGTSPGQKHYQLELQGERRLLKLSYQQRASEEQLHLEAKDFPWSQELGLLKPHLSGAALVSGVTHGKWKAGLKDGEWGAQVKLKEIASLEGTIPAGIRWVRERLGLPATQTTEQSWDLSAGPEKLEIKALNFESPDSVRISGTFRQNRGQLTLSKPLEKRSRPLTVDVDTPPWQKDQE